MDKKGEVNIGMLISIAIIAIVGAILLVASAQNVGVATNQITTTNTSVTAGAVSGVVDLTGQEIFGTPVVFNFSNDTIANTSVFTFSEGISDDTGLKSVQMTTNNFPVDWAGQVVFVTYTYGADGYIDNSGGRSIASLIIIFFGLAIAVVMLFPTLRSNVLNSLGGIGK